jgi:hypothetical protein
MPVTMKRANPPCNDVELARLEKAIGGKLPKPFVRFLRSHNGGRPDGNVIEITGGQSDGVSEFLTAAEVAKQKSKLSDRLPEHWWPIAETGTGNYFLLHDRTGAVAFFDHETEIETKVAPDFDGFLNALRPFSPKDVEGDPDAEVWVDPNFLEELKRKS